MNRSFKYLAPLSWLYGAIIFFRNLAYDFHIIPVRISKVPVISVGNLTVGGTGKTPFIEFLLGRYLESGINVCVVSRGYKRKTTGTLVVSDGRKVFGNAQTCGDEPVQIAKKYPNAIVVVDEKRNRAVEHIMSKFSPGLILLDDAYQHRSIGRNLDIVMVDGRKNLLKMPMFPAGGRREPLSALRRADLFVFNHVTSISQDVLESFREYSTAPAVGIRYHAKDLRRCADDQTVPVGDLKDAPCVAFCGIGDPTVFKSMLAETGARILDFIAYPDHHFYTANELTVINHYFRSKKAKYIITTEKDAVRLQSMDAPREFPRSSCFYLQIGITFVSGEGLLKWVLKDKIDKLIS